MQIGGKQLMWIGGLAVVAFIAYKHFKKPAVPVPTAIPGVNLPVPGLPVAGSPLPIPTSVYPQSTVPQVAGQYANPYGGLVPQAGVYPQTIQQALPPYQQAGNIIASPYPVGFTGGSAPGMLAGFAGYAN